MGKLILLSSPERLEPHDTTGQYALGWNFSVALDPDFGDIPHGEEGNLVTSFLKPWTWDSSATAERSLLAEIDKVHLFRREPSQATWQYSQVELAPRPPLAAGAVALYRQALEKQFRKCGAEPSCLVYRSSLTPVSRKHRPWPAILADQATQPYPLPQALGLARFARVDADPQESSSAEWLVFPVLKALNAAGDLWEELEVGMPALPTTAGEPATLTYSDVDPLSGGLSARNLTLEGRSLVLKRNLGGNLANLWVNGLEIATNDWRAGFEDRLAAALDPGPVFAGWLESLRKKIAAAGTATERERLRAVAYGLAKSAANIILLSTLPRKATAGTNSEWARLAPPEIREQVRKTLESAAGYFAQNPKKWVSWLETARRGSETGPASLALLRVLEREDGEPALTSLEGFPLEVLIRELHSLSQELATPEVARRLFEAQLRSFRAAANTSEADRQMLDKFLRSLPEYLNFRLLQLKEHLRLWWPLVVEKLEQASGQQMAAYKLEQALSKSDWDLALPLQQWLKDWSGDDANVAKGLLDLVAPTIAAHALQAGAVPRQRAGASLGITLQIHSLGGEPGNDLLSQIRGIGVLVRRSGGQWYCLNQAKPRVLTDSVNHTYQEIPGLSVLLPSRLAYVDGLSAPLVTYNNAPLTTPSPIALEAATGWRIGHSEGAAVDPPMLHFARDPAAKMPGLAFASSYEFLAFVVTNSGALPKELAAPHSPWEMHLENFESRRQAAGARIPTPKGHPYRREVHVGALRFAETALASSGGLRQALRDGMPPIPPQVSPKARELSATILHSGDPLLKEPLFTDANEYDLHSKIPLLLLAPASLTRREGVFVPDRFDFQLQCPAIDLETWDRWQAADYNALPAADTAGKQRKQENRRTVRVASYVLGQEESANPLDNDRSLDDPAVDGMWIELKEVWPQVAVVDTDWIPLEPIEANPPALQEFGAAACRQALEARRRPKVQVSIAVKTNATFLVTGPAVAIEVQPEKVYRLTAYAGLNQGFASRFAAAEDVRTEGNHPLTSPWHLLIETAPALPERTHLELDQLEVEFDIKSDTLVAKARPTKLGPYHRAELLQQTWHWRGRVPAALPVDLTRLPGRLPFEMSEFGDRSDDEHRLRPMQPVFGKDPPRPLTHFEFRDQIPRSGVNGDPRSQYHRLSARVYSRYEGLLPENESFREFMDSSSGNRWKPVHIPCRFAGEVPPPNIKMVLPLTGGKDQENASPGLLVVVDGPWYEVGGLAEKLDVEVMTVASRDCNPGEDCADWFYQVGTDPILTGQSIGDKLGMDNQGAVHASAGNSVTFGKIPGAIGLQRDRSSSNPYFLASSFILPQPQVSIANVEKPIDLAWVFLKLRFRRKLENVNGSTNALSSEPSSPFWVQLLPAMARIEEDYFAGSEAEEMEFTATRDGKIVTAPKARATEEAAFLVGVITRQIEDAVGRGNQEAFASMALPSSLTGTFNAADFPTSLADGGGLRIRWLVVQQRPGSPRPVTQEELWDLLFAPGIADHQRARILRMSRPHLLRVQG